MGVWARIASEYAYLTSALRALSTLTTIARNPQRTYPDVADGLAETFGDRLALISERETLTYLQYNERANQYARWALAEGVGRGDCVALLMPNRPEYLAAWLGVARAGGVTALLNTNLTGPALAHCIDIVAPRHIIVDAALADRFATARAHLTSRAAVWSHGAAAEGCQRLDSVLDGLPNSAIPADERPVLTTSDRCLFIYTSGTTGMPKAANINHYRVQSIMLGFRAAMRMTRDDRIYVCLPMYHTSGGLIACGAALTAGGSAVIREKFSASQFWDDIVRHDCTAFQYIGELCRYLLNSPTSPAERTHRIRLACGNGLRPDIWEDFQRRFRIPKILEWYAATEGNAVFFNFDGKVGAIGRIPKWAERKFVTEIVEVDLETEQPVRGAAGFCVKLPPGGVGEVISQVLDDPKRPSQRFEGYADPDATKKKVLHDVFARGDSWFRTGDLMRKDALGYHYFIDRMGDTFRWKGENVATSEVSEALTAFPGVKEANIYGVQVPGADGRAGMAALVVEDHPDLEGFARHVARQLPAYARPVFLRIQHHIEATSTFKPRKRELVAEGFDPALIADPLYVFHPERQAYVPLDAPLHEQIRTGKVRL